MAQKNEQKAETLGEKLRKLQASVKPTFAEVHKRQEETGVREEAPAELVKLADQIEKLRKLAGELRAEYDKAIDLRDEGAFGMGFAPGLKRLRAKSENVGRPKKEKADELAELDI